MLTFALICWLFFAVWLAAMVAVQRFMARVLALNGGRLAGIGAVEISYIAMLIYYAPLAVGFLAGRKLGTEVPADSDRLRMFLAMGTSVILPSVVAHSLAQLSGLRTFGTSKALDQAADRRRAWLAAVAQGSLYVLLLTGAIAWSSPNDSLRYALLQWLALLVGTAAVSLVLSRRSSAHIGPETVLPMDEGPLFDQLRRISELYGVQPDAWRIVSRQSTDVPQSEFDRAVEMTEWQRKFRPTKPQLPVGIVRSTSADTITAIVAILHARSWLADDFSKDPARRGFIRRALRRIGLFGTSMVLLLALLALAVLATILYPPGGEIYFACFISGMILLLLYVAMKGLRLNGRGPKTYEQAFEAWKRSTTDPLGVEEFLRALHKWDMVVHCRLDRGKLIQLVLANRGFRKFLDNQGFDRDLGEFLRGVEAPET